MHDSLKRVRSIYSVIASPNRLEILRILNAKGALTYSELKTLAGFKSKKESGKFAYHLRKLVRQNLISLDRAERKYSVTSLGRLVLNLTRQIEEQSIMESGKLYVRTSRHTMEEFNRDKILQSLVKEAGMPLELAEKITNEAESRIYKFQTTYLTAPLIREIVNALLVEHGHESYRHKLTRLGMPVHDVTQLIQRIGESHDGIQTLYSQTASSIFTEYLLLEQLSKDVADAHLSGDINLTKTGTWALLPDSVVCDLERLKSKEINLNGKLLSVPRVKALNSKEQAINALTILSYLLSSEVSNELCFANFDYFALNYIDSKTSLTELFKLISAIASNCPSKPLVSFQTRENDVENIIDSYLDYLSSTPLIRVALILPNSLPSKVIDKVAKCVKDGGLIACSPYKKDLTYTYSGIKVTKGDCENMYLHSVSLNLPRIAYQSARDENYFRAKMAILIQTALEAADAKRRLITSAMKDGLLPAMVSNFSYDSNIPTSLNLVGLQESLHALAGEKATLEDRSSFSIKTLEVAKRVCNEKSNKIGLNCSISLLKDEAGERFANIDYEKYGKASSYQETLTYTTGYKIQEEDLGLEPIINEINWALLNTFGCSVHIKLPNPAPLNLIKNVIQEASSKLRFFSIKQRIGICKTCGTKIVDGLRNCPTCKSSAIIQIE
jgi:ribonucleoside-triphosphate reductase